ncbi:hypothetical protein GQ600_7078 [Phytophthora cactorum]|nr:hypothetical protein GQ600_7078 [Phytophthora cactorum]
MHDKHGCIIPIAICTAEFTHDYLARQALYTAQDVSLPIDYVHCVASHWRRIEQYCDRIIENEGQEELSMVRRIVELNFRCLVVLASRRSQFPAIQAR